MIELIESVIIYKLPRLSREEIETMLQVHDIRETRVYQEAREEGVKEGIEKGVKEGIEKERQRTIAKIASSNCPPIKSLRFWAWTWSWFGKKSPKSSGDKKDRKFTNHHI